MERIIAHLDMNSYFATVEQQANPFLRGKPIAVKGSSNKRTIIVASSIEAKKLGIKTGMMIHEALDLCSNLKLIIGEPRKYSWVTKKLVDICGKYSEVIEIFSIDEVFLDLTKTAHLYGGAENTMRKIKEEIRREVGEWLTCSVGIAENKFLAKLASDSQKPDGLVIITKENKDSFLINSQLEDFCGIGSRIGRRLSILGIRDVYQLRKADPYILFKEFGCYGLKIHRMAWGIDNTMVSSWHHQPDAKSFGHSRTMNRDITSKKEIKRHIYLLAEKVATRMRAEEFWGREVFLWLRFKDFSGDGRHKKTSYWLCEEYDIFQKAAEILGEIPLRSPVRAIGVGVSDISHKKFVPQVFLPEDQIKEKIIKAISLVNKKFGESTLTRGTITGMKLKEIVSGMGRKKF